MLDAGGTPGAYKQVQCPCFIEQKVDQASQHSHGLYHHSLSLLTWGNLFLLPWGF